jgi:glutathione peroxidase
MESMKTTIFDLHSVAIDGSDHDLRRYEGKVLLVVNTASKCAYTKQYKALESLYRTYGDGGLAVIGFPCDQFGHQEPGDPGEIAAFCKRNYGVTFPLMAKTDVNGEGTHPVFAFLKSRAPGEIKWNFTKFLVARDGLSVARFRSQTEPGKMEGEIESVLSRLPISESVIGGS